MVQWIGARKTGEYGKEAATINFTRGTGGDR